MESSVLDAGLSRTLAVSRDPIRVPRKEGVRDRLGDLLLVAPKCPRHDGAIDGALDSAGCTVIDCSGASKSATRGVWEERRAGVSEQYTKADPPDR